MRSCIKLVRVGLLLCPLFFCGCHYLNVVSQDAAANRNATEAQQLNSQNIWPTNR